MNDADSNKILELVKKYGGDNNIQVPTTDSRRMVDEVSKKQEDRMKRVNDLKCKLGQAPSINDTPSQLFQPILYNMGSIGDSVHSF